MIENIALNLGVINGLNLGVINEKD